MRKWIRRLLIVAALAALCGFGNLVADRQKLRYGIIRLHVVAASDTDEDQKVKLAVRDAVIDYLQKALENTTSVSDAKSCILNKTDKLEQIANSTLMAMGSCDTATVTLMQEEFEKRVYDTFSLPSGVYDSLRIRIGKAQGKNWWCVVFPAFCTPATTQSFQETAVSSGFSQELTGALSNNKKYEIRFFLLDCLGKFENFLNLA